MNSLNKDIQIFSQKLDILLETFKDVNIQFHNLRNLCIIDSAYNYTEYKQKCTCDTGLSLIEPIADQKYIRCRRHLCRKYINYGCQLCNYTDCSLHK